MQNNNLKFKIIENKKSAANIKINKHGKYIFFFYNFSGKLDIEILNKNIKVQILGLYFGHKADCFSLNVLQHHVSPQSKSNLLIRGVFFDKTRFEYKGLIKIEKQAQKSKATQKVQCLTFSDKCTIETKPDLEILANNVFCTHGATTGQLSNDQIHYLKTRGIQTSKAKKLLTHGFVSDIFTKLESFGLQDKTKKYQSIILNKLSHAQY